MRSGASCWPDMLSPQRQASLLAAGVGLCSTWGPALPSRWAAAIRAPLHSFTWGVPAAPCGSQMPAQHASSCALMADSPEAHRLAACHDRSRPPVIVGVKVKWPLLSPPRLLLLQLHVIREGAADPRALLGCIRQVHWLAQQQQLGSRGCRLVVDSGTGVTAAGKLTWLPFSLRQLVYHVALASSLGINMQQSC